MAKESLATLEKIRSLCLSLGALSALILGLVANFKGEPVAEEAKASVDKTWETLRDTVNKQTERLNQLHSQVISFRAREEGRSAAALQAKLDQLQQRYDALERRIAKGRTARAPKRAATQQVEQLKAEAAEATRERQEVEKAQRRLLRSAPAPLKALPKSLDGAVKQSRAD